MINIQISTIGWFILVPFVITAASWFIFLYDKDKDKRKLMTAIALYPTVFSFLFRGFGFHLIINDPIVYNLHHWAGLPLLVTLLIMVSENILKFKDFNKIFWVFIVTTFGTATLLFLPQTTTSVFDILFAIIAIEVIIFGVIGFSKGKKYSNLLLIFSLLCFMFAGFSAAAKIEILSIFAFAIALAFFCMIFLVSPTSKDMDFSGVDTYFTIEKKLKTTEHALKQSQEKYSAVVQSSKDAIIIHQDGIIKFVNSAASELTGFKAKELLNKNIGQFIVPKYRQLVFDRYKTRMSGEDVPSLYEIALYRKDGTEFPVEINTSIIKYNGSPAAVVFIRDISERKKTEEALINSLERLKAIFHGATDGILAIDVNTLKLGFANPRICEITGYPLNELSKMSLKDIHPKDELDHIMDIFNKQVAGLISLAKEIPIRKKDGSVLFCDINSKLININNNTYLVGFYRDVTGQKIAYEMVKDSEEKFRRLFEKSSASITIIDNSGIIIDCNKATETLTGYPTEIIVGRSFEELLTLDAEDLPKQIAIFENLLAGNDVKPFELAFTDFDGHKKWINVTISKLTKGNDVTGFQIIASNITDRKAAETALHESEARFKQVAETAGEWIWEVDAEGVYTYSSPVIEKIMGYTPTEVVGKKHFYDFFDPDVREQLKTRAFNAFKEKQPFVGFINTVIHKNGAKVILETSSTPIIDETGQLLGYRGVDSDITERQRAENELKSSEERFKILFEYAPDAYYLNDLEGNFVDGNKAAEKLIGYSKEDMIGNSMLDLGVLPEDQIEKAIESLEKNMKGEPTGPQEFKLMNRNGNLIPVEISTFPIKIHEKELVLGIARDITERKRSEDLLRESEEKFRSLIEDSSDIVLLLDENGEIGYVSPSIEKVWGYTVDEMLEKDLDYYLNEFVHPDDLDMVMKAYIEGIENPGSIDNIECRFKHKDGTWGYVQARGNNLYDNPAVRGLVITLTDISERKHAEEVVKTSEAKYRSLIDNLSDTVIECDSDGNFSYASPQVMDIFGYTTEEIVGQNAFEFIHPDDLEAAMDAMAEALHKGEKYNLEYRSKHKEGHYIYVSGSGKVLQEEDGVRIVGVVRDITERKQWEEELHRSFSITRATLESTEDGILVVDNDGKVNIFNERFVDIWGFDSEQLLTYDIKELNKHINNNIQEPFAFVEIQKVLKDNLDVESFDTIEMKDDRILEVTSKPQYLGENIVGRVWSYRDITERKRSEEAIKNSEAKFRQFFENEPEYCYMVSPEGNIMDINKAALEVMEYTKDELVDQPIKKIYAPEELTRIKELLNRWLETGTIENEELNIMTKSGERRTILLSANSILDDRGKLLHSITVQRDITERKLAQEELERTLSELERSNKELEQFAYIASHDLQEPLRMVSSYVELLKRRYGEKLSDEADDFINFAIEGTKRMQRLINDLLKYSRVSTRGKDMQKTDTEHVLNDVLSDLGMMIEDSGATVTHGKLPTVLADDVQLGQVFQNLVSNALKYHGIEKPKVHVNAERSGNEWLFSVKDNGIGIDEKYEKRVFQIFQQLHPKGKFPGTGIGLAVVKRIIERHKGKIWFESKPGFGTTFYFTIPTTIDIDELEFEVNELNERE